MASISHAIRAHIRPLPPDDCEGIAHAADSGTTSLLGRLSCRGAHFCGLVCGRASRPATRRLALVGGMLLTGYEVPPVHHAAVVIEGTKIAAGPASKINIPADATVLDTSGRMMLPGLIETHAHVIVVGLATT